MSSGNLHRTYSTGKYHPSPLSSSSFSQTCTDAEATEDEQLATTDSSDDSQLAANQHTTKHILVECTNLWDIREKYFTVSSVTDLFTSIDNHTVINFIKENRFLSPTVIFVTLILY